MFYGRDNPFCRSGISYRHIFDLGPESNMHIYTMVSLRPIGIIISLGVFYSGINLHYFEAYI